VNVDHIAFITRQLETITDTLPAFCNPLEIEEQPTEGTREQYVDVAGESAPMLLLMQPISAGPYVRALDKRGPGLHHIGGTTPSIDALLPKIQQHRLLLHPNSLKSYTQHKTIWLCRPGVPFLIELVESDQPVTERLPATLRVPKEWSIPAYIRGFFSNLELQNTEDDRYHVRVEDRTVSLAIST